MKNLLKQKGFKYQPETKDYTKHLAKDIAIRAEIRQDRIKVFLQFDVIEGVVPHWDIVYMNSYRSVSFKKLLYALTKLINAKNPKNIKE